MPSRLRDDSTGFTLIEVLIALVLLGIGVAALLAALGMQVTTSSANREQSQAQSTLTAAAEYVKSVRFDKLPACDGTVVTLPATGSPVPHDPIFTVSYGLSTVLPSNAAAGSPEAPDCSELRLVTVEVKGGPVNGNPWDLELKVLRRARHDSA